MHERSVGCAEQKPAIDEDAQDISTRDRVEVPQTTGLTLCEAQTGHLEELTLNALKKFDRRVDGCETHTPSFAAGEKPLVTSSTIAQSGARGAGKSTIVNECCCRLYHRLR